MFSQARFLNEPPRAQNAPAQSKLEYNQAFSGQWKIVDFIGKNSWEDSSYWDSYTPVSRRFQKYHLGH